MPVHPARDLSRFAVAVALIALPGPASAAMDTPVRVSPLHGRSATTFGATFTPPAHAQRGRYVIELHAPARTACLRPYGDTLYTPGETVVGGRRVTWSFGPRVTPGVKPNGGFSFRPTFPGRSHRPLARWCAGIWHGRLAWEPWSAEAGTYERPLVYARFSFRVR